MCPDNPAFIATHQVLIWNKIKCFLLSSAPLPPISEYLLKILFPSFWVTSLSWFSFFDCHFSLCWFRMASVSVLCNSYILSQADVLMPSIKQIIQNLGINYLMLLCITNLANPLPEWCRVAYSWTSCIYKVISISLPLFLATNCIRCSFKQISTCHSIFTCRTETSLPNYSVLNWPPYAWALIIEIQKRMSPVHK